MNTPTEFALTRVYSDSDVNGEFWLFVSLNENDEMTIVELTDPDKGN